LSNLIRAGIIDFDKSFDSIRFQQSDGKLYSLKKAAETNPPNRTTNRKPRATPTVGVQFQAPNLNDVNCVINTFEDKEFCVLNDCETMSKSEIEKKIYEYGGRVVQNPGKKILHAFCSEAK